MVVIFWLVLDGKSSSWYVNGGRRVERVGEEAFCCSCCCWDFRREERRKKRVSDPAPREMICRLWWPVGFCDGEEGEMEEEEAVDVGWGDRKRRISWSIAVVRT